VKKRTVSILLLIAMLAALSGCSSLFKKEYLSVSEYADDTNDGLSNDISRISDYEGLKDAIISMVNSHKTEGRLRFTDYEGALPGDISRAWSEVKSESALASYAVEYMPYYLSPIATYYEAVVYITYKHTQGEIDAIRYVTGKPQLAEAIDPILDSMGSYTAIRITSPTITEEEVKNAVYKAYAANPAACVVMPVVNVRMHPQSGMHRIIEIELEYGWKLSELQKMKSALVNKINELSRSLSSDKDAVFAMSAYNKLAKSCTYDSAGTLGGGRIGFNSGLSSTAYGALIEGNADSLGIALAYSALCHATGIECVVVNGSLDNEEHSWNIIKIEETYYHVDVSASSALGIGNTFMRSDLQMQVKYTWDKSLYPECNGVKSYHDVLSRNF
jgi:hypothetical protein